MSKRAIRPVPTYDRSTAEGQRRLMAESIGHTYVARRAIDTTKPGDHGADPLGGGSYRMVPSGDIVDQAERDRRLA